MSQRKYVPDTIMTFDGYQPVKEVIAFQPNQHPSSSPIKRTLTAVKVMTDNGNVRWYGFGKAWINSELRMVVESFNPKFEEVSKWEDYTEV